MGGGNTKEQNEPTARDMIPKTPNPIKGICGKIARDTQANESSIKTETRNETKILPIKQLKDCKTQQRSPIKRVGGLLRGILSY